MCIAMNDPLGQHGLESLEYSFEIVRTASKVLHPPVGNTYIGQCVQATTYNSNRIPIWQKRRQLAAIYVKFSQHTPEFTEIGLHVGQLGIESPDGDDAIFENHRPIGMFMSRGF